VQYQHDIGMMSLDFLTKNGPVEKGQGIWIKGWTKICPFYMANSTYLLEYNIETGEVAIDKVYPNLNLEEKYRVAKWSSGWTTIEPFVLSHAAGKVYLLEYKSNTGDLVIDNVRADFKGFDEVHRSKVSPGWTTILPFYLSKNDATFVYEYRAKDGLVSIGQLKCDGHGIDEKHQSRSLPDWTHIVPFYRHDSTYLLFYNNVSGLVCVDQIRADLSTVELSHLNWIKGWTAIHSFQFGRDLYLLSYRQDEGQLAIEFVKEDFTALQERWNQKSSVGWTIVLPIRIAV